MSNNDTNNLINSFPKLKSSTSRYSILIFKQVVTLIQLAGGRAFISRSRLAQFSSTKWGRCENDDEQGYDKIDKQWHSIQIGKQTQTAFRNGKTDGEVDAPSSSITQCRCGVSTIALVLLLAARRFRLSFSSGFRVDASKNAIIN